MQVSKLFIIVLLIVVTCLAEEYDPYKILGVSRFASLQEIRKVYKKLAKEWHPDKTNDPEAQNKFVQIKQAYELLSDTERRARFDQTGITEDTYKDRFDYSRFHSNPFDDILHHSYFNFQENDIAFFHRLSITSRQYDKIVIPKSVHTPYLILFYTDWCFSCLQTAPYFRKLMDHLEPLGVEFATVHTAAEPSLARRMNVHSLPCLTTVIDENVYVFKDIISSPQKIIEFLRHHLPYKLITTVTDNNLEYFLTGWEDNKVRALIFEPHSYVRLRYLITAYHFRHRVSFGFVNSSNLHREFQVPLDMDTVLLFNENASRPVASVTMKEIPTQTLNNVISSNQYLALPRLSSQSVLESLCPCEWNKPRKRLCVVLVTTASDSHDLHRQSFRRYAQASPYSTERVRFAYIYHDKQTEFVNALMPDGEGITPLLSIVIIWRRDTSHVKYEWLPNKWEIEENLNDTVSKLETTISRLLKSSEALTYEALVTDLFDEHAKGIFGRIVTKLLIFSERLYEGLSKDQILPVLSIVGTIVFIVGVGYFMAYLVRIEEESVKQNSKGKAGDGDDANYQPELRLHELRAEKYNGLVRLLKPGCRTLILVLDMQSREHLIPPFHKAVWPYRKNKTLMFAYMYVERGLTWYKDLLQLSLSEERDLNINPRNCVGTVLAVNGYRKYFCMFHAKHAESSKKRLENKASKPTVNDVEAAAFIGFNSDSSDSDEEILLEGNLLDGLPNWLDRLFEGTTQRFHFNYWPDFPNK
ncbi:hypothetical protein PPYR_11903 [Photinus pyralis]|uniref:DnaJ homolog subfamily C member 16 n=1 Tax=Photinus pyralis TaxID=7054 RepID=A0A1Y1N5Y4_PHOPY|nr:dnaJ homolog subfamily C member 16 [Photinus pyralis]KAB0795064.1 hypothetical protein PPYR_11903 [Photinus pyralis]